MSFKNKLKDYRISLGLTQAEFSAKYGISRTTISELESGRKSPSLKMINKISSLTGTNTSYWLSSDDDNVSFEQFEGLTVVINKLISTGDIDENGKMNDDAKALIFKILEAEIKLMLKKKS